MPKVGTSDILPISVTFPTRNQPGLALSTVRFAVERSTSGVPIEFVIVDDASTRENQAELVDGLDALVREIGIPRDSVRLSLNRRRLGVAKARNRCARLATGDRLFITDGHVDVCEGWDELVMSLPPGGAYAGCVRDPVKNLQGYGCELTVPFMGTKWIMERPKEGSPIQIAASPATVIWREVFFKVGGFDSGMKLYGAIEPEFSVRVWLAGFEIWACPQLLVEHHFKEQDEVDSFITIIRPSMIQNGIRFGLLYLPENLMIEMLRYYAILFPDQVREGFAAVDIEKALARRRLLATKLPRDFAWFRDHFSLKDQVGEDILL